MFRTKVETVSDLLKRALRERGLETPLLQKRIIDGWDVIAGSVIARYTQEKSIRNQTLYIKISNPALRNDLSMRRSEFTRRLNEHVGAFIIADIRFY